MNTKITHTDHEGKRGEHSVAFLLFTLCFIFLLSLCFIACPTEAEEEPFDGIEIGLPIDGSGTRHYYRLSPRQEVTPSGSNWDIALEAHDGAFFILTNSGDTAAALGAGASGLGGVWFTESTSFDAVTSKDQRVQSPAGDLADLADYTTDKKRYVMVMAAEPVEQFLNVITYAGYISGNGMTPEDPFQYNAVDMSNLASFIPYRFNKREAYSMKGMPPVYTPTMRVYVVRHGDGTAYSKLQLSEIYREPGTPSRFVMKLRHGALE
jgi:hypothetical protein